MPSANPGRIVIVSSPSGGGKTTICRELLSAERVEQGWQFSISYTTRQPRTNEQNGREYHFVDDARFDELVAQGFFAEHFKVHLYKYGTPREPLEAVSNQGGVMVLDIDVQGAKRIKKEFPQAISIFVLPPSQEALRSRLKKRGTETDDQMELRLSNAIREMQTFQDHDFEYVVINEDINRAVQQVLAIVEAHGCRLDQQKPEQLRKITG